MAEKPDDGKVGRGYAAGSAIVGAGLALALSILFFAWLGSVLDRKLKTAPLFLLIGLALGLGGGFYSFWLKISAEAKDK
ncbi:MAG TPA: AtpZ/AtpI family protein [Gemmatimonadales bacterium]|jgi:F0F1-type ATP synthase assembly protein I